MSKLTLSHKGIRLPIEEEDKTDQELIRQILHAASRVAKRKGQEVLYERYSKKVYNKCVNVVKDRDLAQDLTHDVFIKIFVNLHTYKGEASFRSWVYSITYNYCFDYLKKRNRTFIVDLSILPTEPIVDEQSMQEKLFQEAQLSVLESAFDQLKASEKMILNMYYTDRFSVKDISKVLKLSESAIKMRLKRSREHLAQLINSILHGTIE